MKAIKNFGTPTIAKLFLLIIFFVFNTVAVFAQNSGVWVASGSGASTTWTTSAGGIDITASASNYGSGTGYTLNDFQTNDTMGCNNGAYSDATIVGNPSLSIRHTFPNKAYLEFTFSKAVENPVMHFDRLGGGQMANLTTSTLVSIATPGITFTRLSGNDTHFVVTPTSLGRSAGQTYNSLPSECGPPLDGTASGSVRLNGVFQTITFELTMDAASSSNSINDRWEIAFSKVEGLTLDFDGQDDYINRAAFLGNESEVTMMSWVKLDSNFDGGEIMGQRNFRIYVDSNMKLKTYAKTLSYGKGTPSIYAPTLSTNLWYHVAAIYDGNNQELKLYLNGDLVWTFSGMTGTALDNTATWNANYDFEIGRNTENDNNYFEGSIYETRVYSKALTQRQLQRQVYQEIENNAGKVRGTVIPKDIDGLLWSDLILYYKMDILNNGQTSDSSISGENGNLHGMRTYQDYTAPLPYRTKSGGTGNWKDKNNWVHGDVWDISDSHTASAIIKISDDLETNEDHETIGLIIDNSKELIINGDSGLYNSWYLKLDGKIDLDGESQLIQTEESELDVTSSGTLEKDQQGTRDMYTYNYWASPVGVTSVTTNNTSYTVGSVFKDGTNPVSPQNINFVTNSYNGSAGNPITIADYWIWKFANQPDGDYSAWQHVRSTGSLSPGEGFTMKGVTNTSGNVALEQNYTVEGKPNNGTITLPLNAGNDYLVGNPYASAIDAHEFILDNAPTIDAPGNTTGTLYFWEHWGGGSHILSEYQGGYATYNLAGSVPAVAYGIADEDVDQSVLIGTKLPGRYIPVGQGFFVVGENTGTIRFNNSQRVFMTEATSASTFMRQAGPQISQDEAPPTEEETDLRMKIRLKFNSVNTYVRKILVTADENATMGYDWGYDAELYDNQSDDMYWLIDQGKYVIQGINTIDTETVLPLGININSNGINDISIDKLENIPEEMDIYLHDIDMGVFHNLKEGSYEVNLIAGVYLSRFEVVFTNQDSLSVSNHEANEAGLTIFHDKTDETITIVNSKNLVIDAVEIFTILGQSVMVSDENTTNSEIKLDASTLSTGAYIVKIKTESGNYSQKVIVN
ncbi:LamG-like jellyroll fold domain-containing protein [uncultured Psychroserpens sp.]|uniref:LamG-like jellyroll fold domain-containing protein n=1 Tax=uncultured Psychroserpens sp. TaxID=255436 RepID=UPI00261E9900|nr:LamG-like jellyroll fold domain-containing protein [uncultured Psychroserpens sp.]